MNRLRQVHLYLGCVFAPLLAFFAVSGFAQNYSWHHTWYGPAAPHPRFSHLVALLSTLHTGGQLKGGEPSTLSSSLMKLFVDAMAFSLIATMVLGVVMAFRFGHARTTLLCLAIGIVVPLALIAFALARA